MRNMRSAWLFPCLFLTLAVIVAGCGSDLQNARVEVYLSNGVELGPLFLGDLAPCQMVDVRPYGHAGRV